MPSALLLSTCLGLPTAGATPFEVSLDVGHTHADPGASSARGRREFDLNLELARHLSTALRGRGLEVRLINFDGRIENLGARPQQAAGSHFFLSVHHDSVHPDLLQEWDWDGSSRTYTDRHSGFSLFVSHDNPHLARSLLCASAIGASLQRAGFAPARHHADAWPGPARQPADVRNAVYYYDRLVVLYRTTLPAVLFEAGVIKHRDEELALLDRQRQTLMSSAIATGIAACLQVPPDSPADGG